MSSLKAKLITLLSRKTSGREFIPEIDGLRSLAILSVVFFHCGMVFALYTDAQTGSNADRIFANILATGEFGVPLFFAISGFILAIPFASHHLSDKPAPPLKKYLLRRLTRLEPPYLFCLLALTGAYLARDLLSNPEAVSIAETLKHTLASMFYLHRPLLGLDGMVSQVFWSLEIEVQFYLLAPFICLVFKLSPILRRSIIVIATLAFSHFYGVDHPIDGYALFHQFSYFLVGLLLADIYLTSLRQSTTKSIAWDLIALVALLAVFAAKYFSISPAMTTPWLAFVGYLAVFKANYIRKLFASTPVVILGGMCYSIYLWHLIAISAYRVVHLRVFNPEPQLLDRLLFLIIATLVAIPFCTIFYILIEHPTMDPKWPSKLKNLLRPNQTKPS